MERGRKSLSYTSQALIFESLNVEFDSSETICYEAGVILDKIIRSYMTFNRDSLQENVFILSNVRFQNSYAYFYYLTAVLLYKCLILKEYGSKPPACLTENIKINMLMALCSCKSAAETDHDAAIEFIRKGLSFSNTYTNDSYEMGLYIALQFEHTLLLEKNNLFFEAINLSHSISKLAAQNYYDIFALSIELHTAVLYSKIGQTTLSTRLNQKIMQHSLEKGYSHLYNAASFNLMSNYLVAEEYDKCLQSSLKALDNALEPDLKNAAHYIIALAYYMTDNFEESKKYCIKIIQMPGEDHFYHRAAEIMLRADHECVEPQVLYEFFHDVTSQGDISDVTVMYKLVSMILKKQGEYKTAFLCAEEYIHHLLRKA